MKTKVSTCAGLIWGAALLAGCSPIIESQPRAVELYREEFMTDAGGWNYYLMGEQQNPIAPCWKSWGGEPACRVLLRWHSAGFVESHDRRFLDPNHSSPGAGYLTIVGNKVLDDRELDLSDSWLYIRMAAEGLETHGANLYFWFQTNHPTLTHKRVNFALTKFPLQAYLSPKWRDLHVPLRADPRHWTCLGSSPERSDFYDCAPLRTVLRRVSVDFGFIFLPVDPKRQPTGVVRIARIAIQRWQRDASDSGNRVSASPPDGGHP